MSQSTERGDTARIEAFSDAVFGFAVTLLVVSLEVPRTFAEMTAAMRLLPAFAASFALLLLVWQEHRAFFKRFGADDGVLLWINGGLLFVVLAYVYPLKFLMTLLIGPDGLFLGRTPPGIDGEDIPTLMRMYGIGFVLLFAMLSALYARAWSWHRSNGADQALLGQIRVHQGASLVYVAIGVVSLLAASVSNSRTAMGISGGVYALTGFAHWLYHRVVAPRLSATPQSPGD